MPVEVKPLFRPDVLRPRLNAFEIPQKVQDQRELIVKWAELLSSSQADRLKEQEILPDFLTDIFNVILGYSRPTDYPSRYTLSREKHVQVDGKFADAVLGEFRERQERFVVALEGKGPTDPLDRPYKNRKMSAVDQGYRYAINLPCDWIIVTSMRQTRLYFKGADQLTYERFHIRELAENDRLLKKFVYLLGAERVVPETGACHLDELRTASEKSGQELTKEFYVRYANVREDMFEQLCASNPAESRHAVLSVTQKVLDRVLFCAFCEDRGLLPQNTLGNAFEHRDPYNPRPIWENFCGLFRSIDEGNEPLNIPPYNGGLFAKDDFLEQLAISDAVCRHFYDIGRYDYRSVHEAIDDPDEEGLDAALVDVDILGHIFEQSITDLEVIRNELDGLIPPQGKEKHKTRRKKEGAFYTPAFITRYIVEQALGSVLEDRFEQLRRQNADIATGTAVKSLADPRVYDLDALNRPQRDALISFWEAWQDELATIRILDPACGSGAFLIEAFEQLHAAYEASNDRLQEIRGQRSLFDLDRRILQNNLYGVDLNEEAIQICRLSLWIKTAQRGKQLTSLDHTIRVGNSVVDDPSVHPLAFDWETAFPEVTKTGGFDVVVGNPPYIRQEWIKQYKPYWERTFKSYHGTADIYVYFYERGIEVLRPGGRLSFVVTNKWMRSNYGEPLRRFFETHAWVESVVDFGHAKQIFEQADVFPSIIVIRRPNDETPPDNTRACAIPREQLRIDSLSDQIEREGFSIPRNELSSSAWKLEPTAVTDLMRKIKETGTPLAEFSHVQPYRGILTGLNDAYLIDEGQRKSLISSDPSCDAILKPFLRGQDNGRWSAKASNQWLIAIRSSANCDHPWTTKGDDAEDVFAKTYPAIHSHLNQFRERLIKRQDQGRFFWELRACAYWDEFEKPKILYQEIQFHPWYSFDESALLVNNKCFIIPTDDLYLLAVLNSPLMWWHNFRHLPHMKDEALSPVGFLMESLPIAKPTDDVRSSVQSAVNRLLAISQESSVVCRDVADWLQVEHQIEKLGAKLADPVRLDSGEFVAEVKKRRGKRNPLSVAALKSLREEHARSIEPVRQLLAEALKLEYKVSDCVNQAYGLTAEEIKLMWQTAPPRMPIERPTGTQIGTKICQ